VLKSRDQDPCGRHSADRARCVNTVVGVYLSLSLCRKQNNSAAGAL
jgi:hypothetical protein